MTSTCDALPHTLDMQCGITQVNDHEMDHVASRFCLSNQVHFRRMRKDRFEAEVRPRRDEVGGFTGGQPCCVIAAAFGFIAKRGGGDSVGINERHRCDGT